MVRTVRRCERMGISTRRTPAVGGCVAKLQMLYMSLTGLSVQPATEAAGPPSATLTPPTESSAARPAAAPTMPVSPAAAVVEKPPSGSDDEEDDDDDSEDDSEDGEGAGARSKLDKAERKVRGRGRRVRRRMRH